MEKAINIFVHSKEFCATKRAGSRICLTMAFVFLAFY